MMPPLEMEKMQERMARIEAIVRRDSDGFFDEPKCSEDLQITVRIACEFYLFLEDARGTPEWEKADYVLGTIRSGMDWFFSMAGTGRILSGLKLKTGFVPKLPSDYVEFKACYNGVFQQLLDCTHSVEALGCFCH
jgi:hypothetical protein